LLILFLRPEMVAALVTVGQSSPPWAGGNHAAAYFGRVPGKQSCRPSPCLLVIGVIVDERDRRRRRISNRESRAVRREGLIAGPLSGTQLVLSRFIFAS